MTKSQLIDAVTAAIPQLSRRDVEVAVNSVFQCITEGLARDERIEVRGFGSFVNRRREAHEGRNPRTGDLIRVPRRLNPFFTAGKDLRDRINGNSSVVSDSEGEAA